MCSGHLHAWRKLQANLTKRYCFPLVSMLSPVFCFAELLEHVRHIFIFEICVSIRIYPFLLRLQILGRIFKNIFHVQKSFHYLFVFFYPSNIYIYIFFSFVLPLPSSPSFLLFRHILADSVHSFSVCIPHFSSLHCS